MLADCGPTAWAEGRYQAEDPFASTPVPLQAMKVHCDGDFPRQMVEGGDQFLIVTTAAVLSLCLVFWLNRVLAIIRPS